ncbi:MAG: leucine--tRNA ligase [Candidatus Omnitrophica bacterium]|nr:leucine--tRNA ligase [Candidatus Omnitrophota bacterium]
MEYDFAKIEKKWQKYWEEKNLFSAESGKEKPKMYILIEFPYPSGEGLHVGHCRSYSALDAIARKKRMEGFNVLYPIGWDAFGLPTENYAIRTGVHPEVATRKNITNFKRGLKRLGISFDWNREINTADPKYYKWTQWIFLQLFKKGLAYQAKIPINWCPSCKIGLANEEVVEGKCERCRAEVKRKERKQWMLKITKYADRLIEDLDKVDYLEKIKVQQINWIGKSEGTEINFKIENSKSLIRVFTTRADTIFGVTAVVLAPEHATVAELLKNQIPPLTNQTVFSRNMREGYLPGNCSQQQAKIENYEEVKDYIKRSKEKSEFERTQLTKEKTGVKLKGVMAINPINSEKIPIWVGDYVVGTYGGGAVMVVPAHDYRDYDFAKKYGLKIREVVSGGDVSKEAFVNYGVLINSGQFNGLSSEEAIKKITDWLEKKGTGKEKVQYKLRDWVFSRQHYWGEPIPIIYCRKCWENQSLIKSGTKLGLNYDYTIIDGKEHMVIAVPEKDLPVKLPYVEKYQPTGTGESPLASIKGWVNVKCPKCGGPAKRETDTMPNWAGSNWYFMRYTDPENEKSLADKKKLEYWMPVDWYNGGMEHTTLHLLYSRFCYKFLYDIGIAPTMEPYQRRTSHGMVLAEDGRKMSKSFENVINPGDIIESYGADTLRIYEMFIGPFDQTIAWNSQGVKGVFRFLQRVWELVLGCSKNKKSSSETIRAIHKLNKKINEDLEKVKFNTPIAALMEFVNFALRNKKEIGRDVIERMLILLAPFAPHIAEELWAGIGNSPSIFSHPYPEYDEKLTREEKVTVVVQIDGKLRARLKLSLDLTEEEVKEKAFAEEKIQKFLSGKEIKKTIFLANRLINLVTKCPPEC